MKVDQEFVHSEYPTPPTNEIYKLGLITENLVTVISKSYGKKGYKVLEIKEVLNNIHKGLWVPISHS